ncbi:DUF1573 domain-containing protein [Aureispira anguillae]|uniref:DUF1573 domain-containing protein n=1 Tax=Aureispira anguillae TaxID=2864201 RepID=A0A915YH27_9BACT|nr:DUF1573 domain-containing protein [Aureispira anguillae]BDS12915.1 DUF1573 domain-containing protein [Aureispira anguillae]
MKMKFMLATILFLLMSNSYAQEIKFETQKIDYGTVSQNSDGTRHFSFTNTGSAPLIIQNAQKSCGCTVPTWPKEPIMPGESAKITVKYNTTKLGAFSKYVTITSNDTKTPSTRLQIVGTIVQEAPAVPLKDHTVFK